MGAQEQERIYSLDDVDTIIDTDAHLHEDVEDILPYLDDHHKGLEHLMRSKHPFSNSVFSSTWAAPLTGERGYAADVDEDATHAEAKLAQMTDFGIDYGILAPTSLNAIGTINNPRFAVALASAYNSYVLDNFLDEEDAFKATIMISPEKPDLAAEEIDRRAGEDDFVSVAMPPSALLPPAGHEKYHPIYQAAQDNDLAITLHGTNASCQWTFPTQYRYTETHDESHFFTHPFQMIWNLGNLIFKGIPEKFPDLSFVFQEAGIGYIPWVKWRLDDIHMEQGGDNPYLNRLPSDYMHEQFRFTTQPVGHTADHPEHLAKLIDIAGTDLIMYSSDLPHPTFDPPEEFFDRIRNAFDADTVNRMMGGNAAELFDL